MRRIIICAILTACCTMMMPAQQNDFLNTLEQLVLALRDHPGKRTYWDNTVATLTEPNKPMVALLDNLVADNPKNEYHKSDAEPMHVNGAVTKSFDVRRGKVTTKGDFYNSLSRGVNYSAIEKTIKGNSSVTYTLSGHHGDQQFIVIPYDGAKSTVEVTYHAGGTTQKAETEISKISRCNIKALPKGTDVTITVTNTGSKPQTIVIINHNAKK